MPPTANTDERYADAHRYMRQRQFGKALAVYQELLKDDERDANAHEGLATAAFMLNDYELAIAHFKRVMMIDPRRSQPLVNLGAVYNRMGDYQSAVQILRKALIKDNKCAEAYYNLGLAHRGLDQSSLAVSAYKEAIRHAPEMAEAYQNLANVYVEMGNIQQAITHYERALQLRPNFDRAKQGLALARESKQKAKESMNPFGRLVDTTVQSTRNNVDAAALRMMSEQERFDDRQSVHRLAKESERAAVGLLNQITEELESALHEFSKAFTQSSDTRAYWADYQALQAATKNFEQLALLLRQQTDDLRLHEDALFSSLKKDAS